jgi:hypothetical protein
LAGYCEAASSAYINITILEPKLSNLIRFDEIMKSITVTHRIYEKALRLLEIHPEGLHWSELLSKIKKSDPSFHPKTVNGCIWKLIERFPEKVYKPSKGLFRLLKYKESKIK